MKDEKGMFQGSPPQSEIARILLGESAEAIPKQELEELVPEAVRRAASNPDNIEVRQLKSDPGIVHVMILERNFPDPLTDPDVYAQLILMASNIRGLDRIFIKISCLLLPKKWDYGLS